MDANSPPVAPFPPTRHWKIAALWDYWCSVASNCGRLPRRSDIDPIDIPKLLPNVWIVDFEPQTQHFRYRIIGTAVTRARNSDLTGGLVETEIPGLSTTMLGRELATVVAECRPVWSKAPPPPRAIPLHDVVEVERLSLPLLSPADSVEMVLNLSVFRLRTGEML